MKVLLTDKFHNKTEKVNNELSRIGVKYEANPLFSLIPLLIQAPVLFSLYFSVLNISTSVGSILLPWVSSLHSIDNLHILPMIAGLFQGLGGLANETRNITFLVLPILFGVVFLWKAPAVLSAYWIVSSALRFLEAKLFTLKVVRTKLLKIPTPEEMIANTL